MAELGNIIGKVALLQGHAYIQHPDGSRAELKIGDPVHEGDVIVTDPGATVEVAFNDGHSYIVAQNETMLIDASVFNHQAVDPQAAAINAQAGQLDELNSVIASGGSLDQLFDSAAAGIGAGGDSNSGHSFVQLLRIVEATDKAAFAFSGGADLSHVITPPETLIGANAIPSVTITAFPTINAAEARDNALIAISGTVSANVPAGDLVTITVGGHSYTGTVLHGGTYSIGVPAGVLVAAGSDVITASVSIHNTSGVATSTVSQAYGIELNAAPITVSINSIPTINGTAAISSSPVNITGSVSSNVPIGDTVTLTVDGHTYTGTVQSGGTYVIAVPGNVLGNAAADTIHASISSTDAAGNTAIAAANLPYAVELAAAPISVTINSISTVNGVEAASANPIAVSGIVSSNVPVGDTVTLTVDGHTYTGTVQTGGTYSIGVPGNVLANAPADSIHVSISTTDAAGNTASASANLPYAVELTAAPVTISIDPIATVNGTTGNSTAPVAVTGTVSANIPVGDQITITVGGQTFAGTVQAGGIYSIGVPGTVLASAPTDSIHATVSTTDAAGNTASASADQPYTVALTGPAISIGINALPTVNGAEAASTNPVNISGTVSANVPVGDTVTLTVDGHTYSGTVQAGGTYTIGVPGTILAGASADSIHTSVSVTDNAGNTVTAVANQSYGVELTAPPVSIGINAIPTVNGAEAASTNPINVTGTVSSNVPAGNTVTLSVDGHTYAGTVQVGGTYSIGVPGSILAGAATDSITATVSMTDAAGNTANASTTLAYNVELTAPAISIALNPIPIVNGAEAASTNPVAVTGTVSSNVPVGDTVTVTVDGHAYNGTVQAGGIYTIGVPGTILAGAAADNIVATISTVDAAGNTAIASATQAYRVELTAPPITISINSIATVNGVEGSSTNPINVSGSVSANVPAGDTVTLTVDGHSYTGTVQVGGTYSIGVPGTILAGAATDTIHAAVSATDAAGNTASASATQTYNVNLTGPVISIGINALPTMNGAEAASSNPVNVSGTVSANVPVGDTVTLTIDGHFYVGTVQAGGTYTIGVPGNVLATASVDSIHASVSVTDSAGNTVTATADHTYSVELTAPPISITINALPAVNIAEAASANPINVTGSVSNNVPIGDTVTLTVGGHTYAGTVQAGGTYSIGIPGNILAAASTDTIVANVSTTDAAGNTAVASANSNYAVDLTVPPTPTVAFPAANAGGHISSAGLGSPATVNATVTLSSAGQTTLANGGSVQVTVNDNGTTSNLNLHVNSSGALVDASGNSYTYSGGVITLTETAPGSANSISISATESDVNGNTSNSAAASATEYTPASTPAVAIVGAVGGELSTATTGATVNATVTLNAAGQASLTSGGSVQVTVVDNGTTSNLNLHLTSSGAE